MGSHNRRVGMHLDPALDSYIDIYLDIYVYVFSDISTSINTYTQYLSHIHLEPSIDVEKRVSPWKSSALGLGMLGPFDRSNLRLPGPADARRRLTLLTNRQHLSPP
jgi:hypothetical protein